MKREVGLWIDHRKAIIVIIENKVDSIQEVLSDMEKHTRFSSGAHSDSPNNVNGSTAEDIRDRQFDLHLKKFYEKIVAIVQNADSVLILGPGEAKVEFAKRLKQDNLDDRIIGIETIDKMSDAQIIAKVRDRFLK